QSRKVADYLIVGSQIPIRVNQGDPKEWTHREQPLPLVQEMIRALLPLPVAVALLAVAIVLRGRMLRTWRDGEARPALVIETHHAALAPMSRAVRCTPADEADNRVFNVYVPRRGADLQRGDTVWLLFPPGNGRPVAAAWFETEGS